MKKAIIFLVFTISFCSKSNAQYVTIPDSLFRGVLGALHPGCMNSLGQLDTSCTDLLSTTRLDLGSPVMNDDYKIHDLTGIQYLKNLRYLNLYNNNISIGQTPLPASLDSLETPWAYGLSGVVLNNTLRYWSADNCGTFGKPLPDSLRFLSCYQSYMDTLTPLPSKLKYLNISNNNIRHLPALPSTLKFIECSGNYIDGLAALPAALTYLNCSANNNITEIPALPNLLDTLICGGLYPSSISQLPALPASITYLAFNGSMTEIPTLPAGLKTLIIDGAPQLSSLPALPPGMIYLRSSLTRVPTLPVLPALLDTLIFNYDTLLTSMPALPAGLTYLECAGNRLAALPALPAALKYLQCAGNKLTSLPLIPDSLQYLLAGNNQLSTAPSIANTLISYLQLAQNELTSISALPATLNSLYCNNNQLTALPTLPASLDTLYCNNNLLASLPGIMHTSLKGIVCSSNQLSLLPEIPASIEYIDCSHNPNLYCLPRLPQPVCKLVITTDTSKVKCIPNNQAEVYIQDYRNSAGWNSCWDYPPYGTVLLPLCNPTNNIGNCQAYPIMSGNIFYDNNSNGVRDNNEPYKTNEKITLQNGEFTFTNNNGYFEMAATGTGANTVTLSPVRFFNCVPAASSYNFTSFDTVVSKAYSLQANQVKDSMSISIFPISWAARPGFAYACQVSYENIGTTALNHTLTITYDNTKLTYDSSNAALANNGTTLSLSTNNFVPGSRQNTIAYFTIKPGAPLGGTFTTRASITANSINYSDSLLTLIGGSFDPNDKQATPQLSPLQVANGKYIDYTVRFQNTGTDTAFNIVIADTLSDDLRTNTLQMIASSHTCKATVKNNIAFFEFRNILLPDSNVNEPKSHGFVSFRIQPEPTVAVNTTIPNKAAIYFDYNTPVITNTATTLIKDFAVVPLRLISFSAVPQTDNTTTLYWNTASEINTRHFVIEQSNTGVNFNSLKTVVAKRRASNNYSSNIADLTSSIVYYRLKIVDHDGSFTYSPIIKIDRRKNAAGFSILSNPVKDFIIINTSDQSLNNTQGNLISCNGAVVKSFLIKQGSQTIDVKGLPPGLYYLRAANGSKNILIR